MKQKDLKFEIQNNQQQYLEIEMQSQENDRGALRQAPQQASVRFQQESDHAPASMGTSRIAPSHEGAMSSRLAGGGLPFSPPPPGAASPTGAPPNVQFHTENLMAFLEKQQKRIRDLVEPDEKSDASLNKPWHSYQQPSQPPGAATSASHTAASAASPQPDASNTRQDVDVTVQLSESAIAPQPLQRSQSQSPPGDASKPVGPESSSRKHHQHLATLYEALSLLIKVLKHHQKLQMLTVGQLLSLTNKLRIDSPPSQAKTGQQQATTTFKSARKLARVEDSHTGESQAEDEMQQQADQQRAPDSMNENVDISMFDLSSEQRLIAMEGPDPEDEESEQMGAENPAAYREGNENMGQLSRGFHRRTPGSSSKINKYKQQYFKARKLFLTLLKQTEELRKEQIHYVLGSLKLLTIFLKVSSALDLHVTTPNKLKFVKFLINLEQRLKVTSFVLIQRLSDEEKMNRIAQEALDTHTLSTKAEVLEKKRMQAQQNQDRTAAAGNAARVQQLEKEARTRANARKWFDQNEGEISIVDSLLFNNFSLSDLCKLKLDFLAILYMRKQFLVQNFDEHTRVELQRFEHQKQTHLLMNEFMEDAKRCHQNLKLLGVYDAARRDPAKIYFEISVKNLILSNRLTGPALAGDPGFASLLQKYYCSQISLDRDPRQIHFAHEELNFSPIIEKLGTPDEVRTEFQRLGRTDPLQQAVSGMHSRNFPTVAENKSTNFTKPLSSRHQSDLTGSVETSSPSHFVPSPLPPDVGPAATRQESQGQRIELMINVPSSHFNGAVQASSGQDQAGQFNKVQKPIQLQISSPVVSSDLLVQSLGKQAFGVELPRNIEALFKIGLLSVVGRQPPQVQWALNAKASEAKARQPREQNKGARVEKPPVHRGLNMEDKDFLGAHDYKSVNEVHNQDLEGCRSEDDQPEQEEDQDLRQPDAGPLDMLQDDSNRNAREHASPQVPQDLSGGPLKSSTGSQRSSKPHSLKDGFGNTVGQSSRSYAFPEELKSFSLCTQDLLLLTDFVALPELISIFCQAQQDFSGLQVRNLQATEPALMSMERIEDFLLKAGKNELYLKQGTRYVESTYPAPLAQKRTKFFYAQNLLPADFSIFQPFGYGPEPLHMHADQDLLLTLLLTSLYNIKSLGQRELPDSDEFEVGRQQAPESRLRRYVEVEAVEVVEERLMTWGQGSTLAVNTLSQTVLMTQYYLNSHVGPDELVEPLKSASKRAGKLAGQLDHAELDAGVFEKDSLKGPNGGAAKVNLIYVLNQLMIHQTLARLKYEHQAIYIPEVAKLFYCDVVGVHKLYAQAFIDLLESDDVNVFGSYAMMNALPGPVPGVKRQMTVSEGATSAWKYAFQPYSYQNPKMLELTLEQIQNGNQSPQPTAGADQMEMNEPLSVQPPMVPYQDFLENPHVDQERRVIALAASDAQEDEVVDLQVQEVRHAKQRFLQKLVNQIEKDHIENEKLHFLVRKHLVEQSKAIWKGPLDPEKDEEKRGHHGMRTASFLPGSVAGQSDGKPGPQDANGNKSGGQPAGEVNGTQGHPASPSHVPSGPGSKGGPQSTNSAQKTAQLPATSGSAGRMNEPQATGESAVSHATNQRGDPRLSTKARAAAGVGGALPVAETQYNKIALQYRDNFKIEDADRTKLMRLLRKGTGAFSTNNTGTSAAKRLTEEQRHLEVEKIERKGLLDIMKKGIIDTEYRIDVWYHDTLMRLTSETKTFLLGGELDKIEELLYACDLELLKQRKVLVTMLKSVEHGMDDREYSIREQLRQIAILEMSKGKDEDEMLDQTLKAIEIDVHIADIAVEKERLMSINKNLAAKQAELEKQVDELDDGRRRKARAGGALSPRLGRPGRDQSSANPDAMSATQKRDSAGRGTTTGSPKDLASITVPGAPFDHLLGGRKVQKAPSYASLVSDDND